MSDIPHGGNNVVAKLHRGCEDISHGCKAASCLTHFHLLLSCGAGKMLCC